MIETIIDNTMILDLTKQSPSLIQAKLSALSKTDEVTIIQEGATLKTTVYGIAEHAVFFNIVETNSYQFEEDEVISLEKYDA